MKMNAMTDYQRDLFDRFWTYQKEYLPRLSDYFEEPQKFNNRFRPPVFLKSKADYNVICKSDCTTVEKKELMETIENSHRHRWFGSMKSSQALAQSVLGNLRISDCLHYLADIKDDFGDSIFGYADITSEHFEMEHEITHLRERRKTSLDGFFDGEYKVAIECKLTEAGVGSCSRPRLRPRDNAYDAEFCSGIYTRQRNRRERCVLTELGIQYWEHIPKILNWNPKIDLDPCPLNKTYQLVRNLLAVCISQNGEYIEGKAHALLICDDRNPAFKVGGDGFNSFMKVRESLKTPNLLRKCSWQRITGELRTRSDFSWLTEQLHEKYGL
jgi:hypothetical protein